MVIKMIIAIVRHGETDYNKQRLIQGRIDNVLNQTGKQQAKTLGEYLKANNETFDVLLTSPLLRAKETAQIVGSHINLEITKETDLLLERDFGPFEGKTVEDTLPFITKHEYKSKGYEDNETLLKRMSEMVSAVHKTYNDKKVLMVAHAHVIKSLLILADFEKYDYINHFVGNSSIVYFEVTSDQISVIKQIDLQ